MVTLIIPFYVLLFVLLIFILAETRYKHEPFKNWLLPLFGLKLIGTFAFVFIYQYYYRGGDTFGYFRGAQIIAENFFYNPKVAFQLWMTDAAEITPKNREIVEGFEYFGNPTTWPVSKIASIFCILGFSNYLITSLWFAFLSFIGQIALFRLFYKLHPKLWRLMAIAVFAVPSVVFWNGGILKDTVILMCLGPLFYSIYWLFIVRKRLLISSLLIIICTYLMWQVKYYVPMVAIPSALLWVALHYFKQLPSLGIKTIIGTSVLVAFAFFSLFFRKELMAFSNDFVVDLLQRAIGFQVWHGYLAETAGASGYDLGEIEFSLIGFIKKMPASINVTLFRPYLWEAKSLVLLVSALESFVFTLLALWVLFKTGIFKTVKIIFSQAHLTAFFIYTMLFAFMVGFTSFNFGALVRYKTPCLAFFTMLLFVIYAIGQQKKSI